MSKPVRHHGKWRIRWIDEHDKRKSAVYTDYREAERQLRLRQLRSRRKTARAAPIETGGPHFGQLCDYWIERRATPKRSKKDDESIIRRHLRPAFGGGSSAKSVSNRSTNT